MVNAMLDQVLVAVIVWYLWVGHFNSCDVSSCWYGKLIQRAGILTRHKYMKKYP